LDLGSAGLGRRRLALGREGEGEQAARPLAERVKGLHARGRTTARLAAQEATARQRREETARWRDEAPTTMLSTISAAFSPVRVVLSFFPSLLLGYLVLGDGDVVAALVDEVEAVADGVAEDRGRA